MLMPIKLIAGNGCIAGVDVPCLRMLNLHREPRKHAFEVHGYVWVHLCKETHLGASMVLVEGTYKVRLYRGPVMLSVTEHEFYQRAHREFLKHRKAIKRGEYNGIYT